MDPLGSRCATGGAHQRPTRTPSRCQAHRAGRTTGRLESPGPPSPPQVSGGQQGAQGNPNLRSSLGSALDLSFGRKIHTPLETENIRLRKRQRDRVGAGGGTAAPPGSRSRPWRPICGGVAGLGRGPGARAWGAFLPEHLRGCVWAVGKRLGPGPCPSLSSAAFLPSFEISGSSEPRPGPGQGTQGRRDPQVPGVRELLLSSGFYYGEGLLAPSVGLRVWKGRLRPGKRSQLAPAPTAGNWPGRTKPPEAP